ncbi:Uma2 family endonuclease [Alicyclobacillus fodiniaquatilis]|uniref:Uma2 family endonuclease n=1 Tax=Alicyclobacillus fodiniaquatilis TaxID=1661150 RepID=A0ABW4JJC2_9BACL
MDTNQVETGELERWERIDGIIYDMTPPPTSDHQSIVSNLHREISVYLKGKTCKVFPAPFGVWLNAEEPNGNYVEPDITVICEQSKIHRQSCMGAPDMIVEVLSPSTALKDKTVKLRAYRVAGVREYWIVDGANEIVEVYTFAENVFSEPDIYGKEQRIAVRIFQDLSIDLKDVF